jgi:hypothetical protein
MLPEILIGLAIVVVLSGIYFYVKLEKDEDLADIPPRNDSSLEPIDPPVEVAVKKEPTKRASKTASKTTAKKPTTKKSPAKTTGKKKLTVAK